ncbi:MAG: endonuclease/exonuclease/phosphatase family protein [Acidimicrobiia bacterium]|nr:endonuclease/exonuclease/phosphatase family protein [Acidimicrobiia bacterium]
MEIGVATYNTGLLDGFIPHAAGRRGAIAERLERLDADLVALQEVWSAPDRDVLTDASPLRHGTAADDHLDPEPGYALDGSTGLLLRSRWPLLTTSVVTLPSYFTRRAVVVAEVDGPVGPFTVLATHLAADIRNVEHPGAEGWAGEHRAHVQTVLRLAAEAAGPVILVGDLNCGPERAGRDPEFPENYDLLRSGFESSAYADDPEAPCTWCPDNPLVHFERATVLDHVMESGFHPVSWRRIFDRPVTVEGDEGATLTTLSDHYGVLVRLRSD